MSYQGMQPLLHKFNRHSFGDTAERNTNMALLPPEITSLPLSEPMSRPRKVKDVPYVELFGGRVQGVVSSGSDENRVYVSFFEAGSSVNFNCSTNNNRPCSGCRGTPCKHLAQLMSEAVLQFGAETVARYLKLSGDLSKFTSARDIMLQVRGVQSRLDVSQVFSRFLSHLRYFELASSNQPIPEMTWFVSG